MDNYHPGLGPGLWGVCLLYTSIISLNEEKTQEKAAEKAFMDEEMKKLRKRYQREKEEICARYVAEGKAGYGA